MVISGTVVVMVVVLVTLTTIIINYCGAYNGTGKELGPCPQQLGRDPEEEPLRNTLIR